MFENHSSGLQSIQSYMSNMTSNGDIDGALGTTAIVFKVAVFIVMVIGGLALAIWTFRIGADILALSLPKGKMSSKIGALGTGEADNYDTVGGYLKKNALNTILMLVLIVFLVTGWIFQIAGMVMTGFGMLMNKIVGIDIEGSIAQFDAQNYDAKADLMTPTQLKGEYDENVAAMRSQRDNIYEIGGGNPDPKDPKLQQAIRQYGMYYARASIAGKKAERNASDFKVPRSYFAQHKTEGGSGVCVTTFLKHNEVSPVLSAQGVSASCSSSR